MKGRNQLLKGMKGSFENITAVQAADGDTILKGKITSMSNPQTTGQTTQRNRFSSVVALASALKAVIRTIFSVSKPTRSPYNEFVSDNVDRMKVLGQTDASTQLAELSFAKGDQYPGVFSDDATTPSTVSGGTVNLNMTWEYDANSPLQDGTDKLDLLMVEASEYDYRTSAESADREEGEVQESFPMFGDGDIFVIAYFRNPSTGKVSSQKPVAKITQAGAITFL